MMDLRAIWKNMPIDTHIAVSTDIATIAVCPWKFRLPKVFGSQPQASFERQTLAGRVCHEVLSVAMLGPVLDVWRLNLKDSGFAHRALLRELESTKNEVLSEELEKSNLTDEKAAVAKEDVEDRLFALTLGFSKDFVSREPPPKLVRTELLISNPRVGQEGRLDALMEADDGRYVVLDWKTYSNDPPHSHGYDHFQLVANGFLANYRYKREEEDFSSCGMAIVYYGGVYFPNPPSAILIEKVKTARKYVLDSLCGRAAPRAKMPPWTVCYDYCPYFEACWFYREEMRLSREGALDPGYDSLRRLLWSRRYTVIEKRAVTHKEKYLVEIATSQFGDREGLEQLKRASILEDGYRIVEHDIQSAQITLYKQGGTSVFGKRSVVRIIGIEENMPLLACVNAHGSVYDINGDNLTLKIYGSNTKSAIPQLAKLPVALLKSNVDLTARELGPLDLVHRKLGELM